MFRRMGICLRNLLLCYEVLILNMRKLWETRESFKKSFPRVWGCFLDRKPRGELICPHLGGQVEKAPLGYQQSPTWGYVMSKGYSEAFKKDAVRRYLAGEGSYRALTIRLGLKDKRQLRNWVAKFRAGESLEDNRRGGLGRPHTHFSSIEEELAHVTAERDYLKKLYRSRFGKEWGAKK